MKRKNNICFPLWVGVELDYFCALQLKPTQWHFKKPVCRGPASLPSSAAWGQCGGGMVCGGTVRWEWGVMGGTSFVLPPHRLCHGQTTNPPSHQTRLHSVLAWWFRPAVYHMYTGQSGDPGHSNYISPAESFLVFICVNEREHKCWINLTDSALWSTSWQACTPCTGVHGRQAPCTSPETRDRLYLLTWCFRVCVGETLSRHISD